MVALAIDSRHAGVSQQCGFGRRVPLLVETLELKPEFDPTADPAGDANVEASLPLQQGVGITEDSAVESRSCQFEANLERRRRRPVSGGKRVSLPGSGRPAMSFCSGS